MKKFLSPSFLFTFAFLIVGSAQSLAGDLIGQMPYIGPSQERDYRPRIDAEERYMYGGAAAGLGLASLATKNSAVRVAATIFGGAFGNQVGTSIQRREEAYLASRPQPNCEVITVSRTNTVTGQNEGQHAQYCREKFRGNIPHADMPDPGAMSYKHGSAQALDPLAGLSPDDRKAVEESRARKQGVTLSEDELRMLEEYRKVKPVNPTGTTQSGTAQSMKVSFKPCQRFVAEQLADSNC